MNIGTFASEGSYENVEGELGNPGRVRGRVVPSPTGLPSKRGPVLGSFSRADRGIGGVRPVAPPTCTAGSQLSGVACVQAGCSLGAITLGGERPAGAVSGGRPYDPYVRVTVTGSPSVGTVPKGPEHERWGGGTTEAGGRSLRRIGGTRDRRAVLRRPPGCTATAPWPPSCLVPRPPNTRGREGPTLSTK